MQTGQKKYILKKLAERLGVPRSVIYRPKRGFGIPLVHWFRNELKQNLLDLLLAPKTLQRGYFNPIAVKQLVNEHLRGRRDRSSDLWILLVFELWHRNFLEKQQPHPKSAMQPIWLQSFPDIVADSSQQAAVAASQAQPIDPESHIRLKAMTTVLTDALKVAKNLTLRGARTGGIYSAFKHSNWRNQRLLILGYHGISLRDEHEWRPGLFMPPEVFAERMNGIARMGCTVLSLDEAVNRLQSGTLPAMSVVITFDDRFYNCFGCSYPILKEFGYPATVYQTTYYAGWNRPIFHLMCHYLLWKASGKTIAAHPVVGRTGHFNLRTQDGIDAAGLEIWNFARSVGLSPEERQRLAQTLADSVGVDYQEISKRRLFNLMNKDELSQMVKSGVDIQLHTHRHRVPTSKDFFLKELYDNREFLKQIGQPKATHFTYPSGLYRKEVFPWLSEVGVRSATTCETGLVSSQSNPMCLPRFIDTTQISNLEFEAWLCGLRELLPGRHNASGRSGL